MVLVLKMSKLNQTFCPKTFLSKSRYHQSPMTYDLCWVFIVFCGQELERNAFDFCDLKIHTETVLKISTALSKKKSDIMQSIR